MTLYTENLNFDPSDYFFGLLKVLRVLSLSRLEKVFKRRNSPLGRVVFMLIFELFTVILIFSGFTLEVENRYYRLPAIEEARLTDPDYVPEKTGSYYRLKFLDMIYYTVVTTTTAGYGDISPQTIAGQVFFILYFATMIVVAQMRISEFIKVHSLTSQYGRVKYEGSKDKNHFLLLGESQTDVVTTFMNECFHTDHGKNETEIVILRESEPTAEINHILKMP